jgi:hypothetical protein
MTVVSDQVSCPGSALFPVLAIVGAGASVLTGSVLAGAAMLLVGLVACYLVPRAVERRGAVLQIHYVLPRTRSLSVSRVRGVTIERSVWMTRIELDTGYPIVLPGWVPAVKRLVE